MKKKKHKFKELNINIGENKNLLESSKIIKTIENKLYNYHHFTKRIKTLNNISYFILLDFSYKIYIYSKETLELIQEINNYSNCYIINEYSIILTKYDIINYRPISNEIWIKNNNDNKFIKTNIINIPLDSSLNNIINSELYIYFPEKMGFQVWDIKNNIPHNLIYKIKTINSLEKQLLLLNKGNLLLVNHHCSWFYDSYKDNSNISISFYETKNYENVTNLEKSELSSIIDKLDENRIIIMEYYVYDDQEHYHEIKQYIKIMKIPEFEIVHKFKPDFPSNRIITYKNYFILYSPSMIQIFNSDNYQLFEEIDIKCVYYLNYLKDNYFVSLIRKNSLYNINLELLKINV